MNQIVPWPTVDLDWESIDTWKLQTCSWVTRRAYLKPELGQLFHAQKKTMILRGHLMNFQESLLESGKLSTPNGGSQRMI